MSSTVLTYEPGTPGYAAVYFILVTVFKLLVTLDLKRNQGRIGFGDGAGDDDSGVLILVKIIHSKTDISYSHKKYDTIIEYSMGGKMNV
ncbi:hypothetical protein [Virgibacillus ndiopensis]|uniref:hypothetical protein n=1 Tax=Virgibacillus ndiopensis TaxID=2004408 RepID=UPI000C0878A3|nr:hypothetical protein [Virgibacillus ndiopensis]